LDVIGDQTSIEYLAAHPAFWEAPPTLALDQNALLRSFLKLFLQPKMTPKSPKVGEARANRPLASGLVDCLRQIKARSCPDSHDFTFVQDSNGCRVQLRKSRLDQGDISSNLASGYLGS